MQREMDALIGFIETYAEDYLEDGTKKYIIEELKSGNMNLALELMKSMNEKWIERTKEVNKFYLFTDTVKFDSKGNFFKKTYYRSSYIDSLDPNNTHIPTLRKVKPSEITYPVNPVEQTKWNHTL